MGKRVVRKKTIRRKKSGGGGGFRSSRSGFGHRRHGSFHGGGHHIRSTSGGLFFFLLIGAIIVFAFLSNDGENTGSSGEYYEETIIEYEYVEETGSPSHDGVHRDQGGMHLPHAEGERRYDEGGMLLPD